jgi:tRNA (adenine37-N6)-methyltransferase
MDIRPIGVVHSPVANPEDMPFEGVPARLELSPEFEKGLKGIESGTHIVVIGWLDRADRTTLQVAKTRTGSSEPRGVFGLRSSHRPNPLSLTIGKLERVEGNSLFVERLDLVNGTPLVDLKRYSPSWDCVFSARSSRDLRLPGKAERRPILDGMMVEASNFHGESCVGVAMGVRIMHHAMEEWQIAQKDPKVVIHMGSNGCITDAMQGLTGATLGSGRMKVPGGRAYRLSYDNQKVLAYTPRDLSEDVVVEDVLQAKIDDLFSIRADVYADGSGPHGGRPAKPAPSPEKREMLLVRVRDMAIEGRLPCAAAHHLADELGVTIPDVGWAADEEKLRITKCQLGCFK